MNILLQTPSDCAMPMYWLCNIAVLLDISLSFHPILFKFGTSIARYE